jgi:hypothetical protein
MYRAKLQLLPLMYLCFIGQGRPLTGPRLKCGAPTVWRHESAYEFDLRYCIGELQFFSPPALIAAPRASPTTSRTSAVGRSAWSVSKKARPRAASVVRRTRVSPDVRFLRCRGAESFRNGNDSWSHVAASFLHASRLEVWFKAHARPSRARGPARFTTRHGNPDPGGV